MKKLSQLLHEVLTSLKGKSSQKKLMAQAEDKVPAPVVPESGHKVRLTDEQREVLYAFLRFPN
jgi:hypothetical protein